MKLNGGGWGGADMTHQRRKLARKMATLGSLLCRYGQMTQGFISLSVPVNVGRLQVKPAKRPVM